MLKFFYKLFFHTHHHYTSLLNLNPLSLTPFVCLHYITLNATYYIICHGNIIFDFHFSDIQPDDGLNN